MTRFATTVKTTVVDAFAADVLATELESRVGHYEPSVVLDGTTIVVSMRQDPIPGWGHSPQDHVTLVEQILARFGITTATVTAGS